MFYMLERKKGKVFDQLGIVVANSVEEAANKISIQITSITEPPESRFVFAELAGDRYLSEIPEITKFADIPRAPRFDDEIIGTG